MSYQQDLRTRCSFFLLINTKSSIESAYEDVHAVDDDEGDDGNADRSDHQSGVAESFRHGEHSGADVALQQVDQRLHVPYRAPESR